MSYLESEPAQSIHRRAIDDSVAEPAAAATTKGLASSSSHTVSAEGRLASRKYCCVYVSTHLDPTPNNVCYMAMSVTAYTGNTRDALTPLVLAVSTKDPGNNPDIFLADRRGVTGSATFPRNRIGALVLLPNMEPVECKYVVQSQARSRAYHQRPGSQAEKYRACGREAR
jgi:hypothetical protein